ncbi:hypothetical protein PoB_005291400 [Plakobranchus ocellatus]|uniref:Uncharacterized protein n=1 Tax=Plakobranchus ocellatus TaxID=259542 RepID=A0AAV4C5T9_9GAST|nr:hypothetical protein PoB_005291400 [Plakobranchus ocellatus]
MVKRRGSCSRTAGTGLSSQPPARLEQIGLPVQSSKPSFQSLCTGKFWNVGGSVVGESALRSVGTFLSRVRVPTPAPWPDGGPKGLRSLVGWL